MKSVGQIEAVDTRVITGAIASSWSDSRKDVQEALVWGRERRRCRLENGISVAGDGAKSWWGGGRRAAREKERETLDKERRGEKEERMVDGLGPWMEWIQLSLRVSWLVDVWLSARESLERDGYLFLLGEIFSRRDTGCFNIYIYMAVVWTNEQRRNLNWYIMKEFAC